MAAVGQMIPMLQDRDNSVVNASKEIIVAELNQGDLYTKRARPTVIYAGLAMMFLTEVLIPAIVKIIQAFRVGQITEVQIEAIHQIGQLDLPPEFWVAWGGVVSVYAVGRSAEKRGAVNKVVEWITGNKAIIQSK
jgi:hypothetical protein